MPTSPITLNGTNLTLVALPGENLPTNLRSVQLWFRNIEWNIEDAVTSTKGFTGQTQAFEWAGAEDWYGTFELPPLDHANARLWQAFLAQCRGILNPFLLGDPLHARTAGSADGNSKPVCDTPTSAVNKPMSKFLQTRGWKPNTHGLMLAGDHLQVGYRLYILLDDLSSDANGSATVEVWHSLCEQPPDGTEIIIKDPRGLFRLGTNKRTWSTDPSRLSSLSVPFMEYR